MEEIGVEVINAELITTLDVKEEVDKKRFTYMVYMITDYRGIHFNCSGETFNYQMVFKARAWAKIASLARIS